MKTMIHRFQQPVALLTIAVLAATTATSEAGRSIHRSVNVHSNRNVNINSNRNVHVNANVHRHVDVDIDRHHHGFGVGLAAGMVTGAVIGAAIAAPPRGYSTVYVGSAPYAYYGGTYYQPSSSGYVVVAPPIGVIVPVLPPGASVAVVNGGTYYSFNGLYYQPVLVNGGTQYRTVQF
jgi:hypothetical protein